MCARAVERLQIGMDDAICMQQPEASRQGHDHVDRFAEIEVFLNLIAPPHARYVQMKQAINNGIDMSLTNALQFEETCYAKTIHTEDRLEGLNAFAQKRKPNYKGR